MELPLLLQDLTDFVYPRLCYVCESTLPKGVSQKCIRCRHELQVSDMYLIEDNELVQRVKGRLELVFGAAMYRFYKGSKVQTMIHRWKYQGHSDIGRYLGQEFGGLLAGISRLSDIDGIIPVPLHPSRMKSRGYNQAMTFAKGLSEVMGIPVIHDLIIRKKNALSQTGKGREDRLLGLMNSFTWRRGSLSTEAANHFLLVDDILTTGATLEAMARPFLDLKDVRLSLATVALGQK